MTIKPGTRLWSTSSATAVVVVRAPATAVKLTCGDAPMATVEQPPAGGAPADGEGTLLGKRYADAESGLEVMCVRAGTGVLAVDGRVMSRLAARPLPASD